MSNTRTQIPWYARVSASALTLFVTALWLLWLPVYGIVAVLRWRREVLLRRRMAKQGRLIAWDEFMRDMENGSGTLVIEWQVVAHPYEGISRWWWTSEDVWQSCPLEIGRHLTKTKTAEFSDAVEWCRTRYCGETGSAHLVLIDEQKRKSVRGPFAFSEPMLPIRWIDLPPRVKS